jgi:hypothetical protein
MLSSILKDYPYFTMWLMLGKSNNVVMQLDFKDGWEEIVNDCLMDKVLADERMPTKDAGDD